MPFVIELRDKLPKGKHSKGRGAPYGVVRHQKFLLRNRGKWGLVSNESSSLAAKLVSAYWEEKYSLEGLQARSVGRQVWVRYPNGKEEPVITDAPPPSGASVRAPEEKKDGLSESEKRTVAKYLRENPEMVGDPLEEVLEIARDEGYDVL